MTVFQPTTDADAGGGEAGVAGVAGVDGVDGGEYVSVGANVGDVGL